MLSLSRWDNGQMKPFTSCDCYKNATPLSQITIKFLKSFKITRFEKWKDIIKTPTIHVILDFFHGATVQTAISAFNTFLTLTSRERITVHFIHSFLSLPSSPLTWTENNYIIMMIEQEWQEKWARRNSLEMNYCPCGKSKSTITCWYH